MTTALLLENPDALADEIFLENGIEVIRVSSGMDEDELIDALQGVQILGIRSHTQVTRRVLEACPELLAVGAFCIGTNQIDKEAAAEHGVAVFNAPYSNTRSVVELAIAEIIMMGRRLMDRTNSLHDGVWNKSATHSHEVRGRTLGIVGYGSIGSQLSVLAEALGMKVIFYDIAERLALGNAQRMETLDDLLREADVVSLHVSGEPANTNLFGDREFALMRPRSLFINLSRGFIVDIEALKEHLLTGHIAGAAVDVFPTEPKANGDLFESPLRGIDNVILTPHIGGSTIEAQQNIGKFVSGKLVEYLNTGRTGMSVNLPNLQLPVSSNAKHRLALVHQNIPGVMAEVNHSLAEHDVNVVGQALKTDGEIGYAVTDIAGDLPREILDELANRETTIRLRYLTV